MRLLLNNNDYLYTDNTSARLVTTDTQAMISGNNTLYGITDDGTRYRLNPTTSGSTLDLKHLQKYVYVPTTYGGSWQWQDTSLYIVSDSVPQGINADDTYNFEGFGLPLILTVFFALFTLFCIFKRR